ncbi:thermonuclease family protein [uncultured Enterovirga sp.]|uniref:thermonuclease family protein n=1 Tax=uncultured Enterovirga sp. TaxID=2026352 RepID=UPI0035CC377B
MVRRSGALDVVVALALAAGLVALSLWIRGEDVSGPVRVVDGDSLDLDGRRIRLKGIDAPELGQTCERRGGTYRCGEVAREALRDLTRGGPVTCRISGQDRYGRSLAICTSGENELGAVLVRRGLAVSYGAYEAEERDARSRHVGLWEGRFEIPSDWRREHRPETGEAGDVRSRTLTP